MKTTHQIMLLGLTFCATALLLSACNKTEQPTTSTDAENQKPADVTVAATNAAEQVPNQTMVTNAALETATDDSQSQAQQLIDKTKALVAEKKYTEALSSLNELSKLKLNSQQQTWMDEIKAQIQKAMTAQTTSDASKSVGDAIPGLK